MKAHLTVVVTLMVLGSVAVCRAEGGEGNGDPFPFSASPQLTSGNPFVSDNGQTHYPLPTGNTVQPSSLAALEPAFGTEAVVQTAGSLPARASEGTVAYVQAKLLKRAADETLGRVREVGVPRPRG